MLTIYLDACCVNRPLDDLSQVRVRLEAEAVLLFLELVEENRFEWVGSEVLQDEVSATPDPERRSRMLSILRRATRKLDLTSEMEARAQELQALGFREYDSLHLACAEIGGADVLLTTDDRLVGLAAQVKRQLRVHVLNPLDWLREVTP